MDNHNKVCAFVRRHTLERGLHVPELNCAIVATVKSSVCHHNWGLMGLLSVAPGRAGEQLCVCNVPPTPLTSQV